MNHSFVSKEKEGGTSGRSSHPLNNNLKLNKFPINSCKCTKLLLPINSTYSKLQEYLSSIRSLLIVVSCILSTLSIVALHIEVGSL